MSNTYNQVRSTAGVGRTMLNRYYCIKEEYYGSHIGITDLMDGADKTTSEGPISQ